MPPQQIQERRGQPVLVADFQGEARGGGKRGEERFQAGHELAGVWERLLIEIGELKEDHSQFLAERFCGFEEFGENRSGIDLKPFVSDLLRRFEGEPEVGGVLASQPFTVDTEGMA